MNSLKFCAIIFLAFFIFKIESQFYTTPKNYVYYINGTHEFTWPNALRACNERGMALATLDSQEKYDDIYNLWKSQTITLLPRLWIGGVGVIGKFAWLSTGKPILPSLWNPSEPNTTLYNQNCLEMYVAPRRGINDYYCHIKLGYICENRGCCKRTPNVLLNINAN